MKQRWILAVAVIAFFSLGNVRPATEFFPLKDVRPGLKGIGKTCYTGGKPQEFQVEILGVLHNMGPGTDAVLARFSGGPLAQTGDFEGMSGSPVFIEGKLLGAVAFSWAFPKEAIGGITPIQQMVDAFTESAETSISGPQKVVKTGELWKYRLPGAALPGAAGPDGRMLQPSTSLFGGHPLVPIATPLNVAGFGQAALRHFEPQLRALGLTVLQGTGRVSLQGGSGAAPPDNTPLEPGSNIVVPLVRGDMDANAAGTLTYIDGNKLYAFGHPLFDLGFTELPLSRGQVITLFPSLQSSFKIVSAGEAIGTLRQDRGSGIYGILGQKARMLPIHIKLNTSRGIKKDLNFEVARDRLLTALLVNLTIYNAITSYENSLGVSTIGMKGKISIKGEPSVEIENRFTSDGSSPAFAALSIALPVNFLLASGYKELDLQAVDLEVQAFADDRSAVLDLVRSDRTEARAGGAVDLDLYYKKANGETVHDSFPVKIPAEVTPGPVTVMVADGTTIMSMDAKEQGEDFIPRNLSQLIRFINNIRKNDRLYVRIYRSEPGAVINGEGLPALPPSLLSILRSERNAGGMSSIQTSVYMEYELPPSEYIVAGSRSLSVNIKP